MKVCFDHVSLITVFCIEVKTDFAAEIDVINGRIFSRSNF